MEKRVIGTLICKSVLSSIKLHGTLEPSVYLSPVCVLDSPLSLIICWFQMDNVRIRGRQGTLHFIRFPTSEMGNFLELAKSKGMANLVTTVCATGGGAFKFEDNFKKVRDDR